MQANNKPREQLEKAKAHIAGLERAADIREVERLWKLFLHDLERVWNKAKAHYGKSPKWASWHGQWDRQRERDPLLAYLRRARDADEHTDADISHLEPGGVAINPTDPFRPMTLRSVFVGPSGVSVGSAENATVVRKPAKFTPLPVVNRGKRYPVPDSHLGEAIDPEHPCEMAEMGVRFYESFLAAAERHFVK